MRKVRPIYWCHNGKHYCQDVDFRDRAASGSSYEEAAHAWAQVNGYRFLYVVAILNLSVARAWKRVKTWMRKTT